MSRIIFEDETQRRQKIKVWSLVGTVCALAFGVWIFILQEGSSPDADVAPLAPASNSAAAEPAAAQPRQVSETKVAKPSSSSRDTGCQVTDGDTLRCGDQRIRLLGIDAPELPGHCRAGRDCVAGDPFAASAALASLIEVASLEVTILGQDHYGRHLAMVYADGENVACKLIADGHAIYVAKWDEDRRLRDECNLTS